MNVCCLRKRHYSNSVDLMRLVYPTSRIEWGQQIKRLWNWMSQNFCIACFSHAHAFTRTNVDRHATFLVMHKCSALYLCKKKKRRKKSNTGIHWGYGDEDFFNLLFPASILVYWYAQSLCHIHTYSNTCFTPQTWWQWLELCVCSSIKPAPLSEEFRVRLSLSHIQTTDTHSHLPCRRPVLGAWPGEANVHNTKERYYKMCHWQRIITCY